MQPLYCEERRLYLKHQIGEEEAENGIVTPTYETSGPYRLSFTPGSQGRTLTEQGQSYHETTYFVIADGLRCFQPGDVLTDGTSDLFVIQTVKTFPTEQTMYVRAL